MTRMLCAIPLLLIGCADPDQGPDTIRCPDMPDTFVSMVLRTLADSTDLFRGAYPPAAPLTCGLLSVLHEELKDDSARYCFTRLSRAHWSEDPHARITHAFAARHHAFGLYVAAAAHWNEDQRILGLEGLIELRRMRPMICTTREGYERLLQQDTALVRYLLLVVGTTPLSIGGSENATIHERYIRTVIQALDTYTGQHHGLEDEGSMRRVHNDTEWSRALHDWHSWLGE